MNAKTEFTARLKGEWCADCQAAHLTHEEVISCLIKKLTKQQKQQEDWILYGSPSIATKLEALLRNAVDAPSVAPNPNAGMTYMRGAVLKLNPPRQEPWYRSYERKRRKQWETRRRS